MLTLIRTKGVKQPLETLQVRPGPLKVNDDYQDQYFALLAWIGAKLNEMFQKFRLADRHIFAFDWAVQNLDSTLFSNHLERL